MGCMKTGLPTRNRFRIVLTGVGTMQKPPPDGRAAPQISSTYSMTPPTSLTKLSLRVQVTN